MSNAFLGFLSRTACYSWTRPCRRGCEPSTSTVEPRDAGLGAESWYTFKWLWARSWIALASGPGQVVRTARGVGSRWRRSASLSACYCMSRGDPAHNVTFMALFAVAPPSSRDPGTSRWMRGDRVPRALDSALARWPRAYQTVIASRCWWPPRAATWHLAHKLRVGKQGTHDGVARLPAGL